MAIISSEKELGLFLKNRRKVCSVTQKGLADFTNLSSNGISQIEIGKKSPHFSTILKLSRLLGFKVIFKHDEEAAHEQPMSVELKKEKTDKQLDVYYRRVYGLSLQDYTALLSKQEGKCRLCDRTPQDVGHRLIVDHNHHSGTIRGLLCRGCNSALGHYEKCLRRTSVKRLTTYLKEKAK